MWVVRFTRTAVAINLAQVNDPIRAKRERLDFDLRCLLEAESSLPQRHISRRLGVSLGRVNHCLKDLCARSILAPYDLTRPGMRPRHAYLLNPGIAWREAAAPSMLDQKASEFEQLRCQIEPIRLGLSTR